MITQVLSRQLNETADSKNTMKYTYMSHTKQYISIHLVLLIGN